MSRPVIFLHIPKTAGQSVHYYMAKCFNSPEICPARENFDLKKMTPSEIKGYKLFSGHLDWDFFDNTVENPFIFTILRDPVERILSFYFFLRREASRLTEEERKLPTKRGMMAALVMSPDEFFCDGPIDLRLFLDDVFDNFYTYYFLGRRFDARRRILQNIADAKSDLTPANLVTRSKKNLLRLDAVYRIKDLAQLEADLARLGIGRPGHTLTSMRANEGEGDLTSRLASLPNIGPAARAIERIAEMSWLDQRIWEDDSVFRRARWD